LPQVAEQTSATGATTADLVYNPNATLNAMTTTAGFYTLPSSGGLDDMNARDYNPANGTFTSVDPMLANTGQPYAYASGER
jgi:RHS repeat-associated protein